MRSIAFEILGYTIYWYGILAAVGFLLGFYAAGRHAPREGLTSDTIMNLAPWIIAGGIIGARLLYVITYYREEFSFKPWFEMFFLRRSGLVYYGGLIGASLATVIYCRKQKLPFWKIADVLAPSIALGHIFGRIGCLMTGCCFGRPTDLPWAIHFPTDHPTHGFGLHPTQVYESLLNAALFAFLIWSYRRKKFDGQIFAIYLISYAFLRTLVEAFRGDYPDYLKAFGGFLTPAQCVSAVILATGMSLMWLLPRTTPRAPSPTPNIPTKVS